jgi:hypothetical protein
MTRQSFYINLDMSKDRQKFWKDSNAIRFEATHYNDLDEYDPIFQKMVSYWNVPPHQHKAKCGAFISHMNMLQHIVDNHLNNVIICEDDAQQVNPIPDDLPDDRVTYLGGFITNKQITKPTPIINHINGLNDLTNNARIVMLLSYHIPKWEIAREILNNITEKYIKGRVRAIDIDFFNVLPRCSYVYPAPYIERDIPSTIRKEKVKHSDEFYNWRTNNGVGLDCGQCWDCSQNPQCPSVKHS